MFPDEVMPIHLVTYSVRIASVVFKKVGIVGGKCEIPFFVVVVVVVVVVIVVFEWGDFQI